MRKQLPSDKTKDMVAFSTQRPADRFQSITAGVQRLQYGQSEYIREFGMRIITENGPLTLSARILPTPALQYGQRSKDRTVVRPTLSFCVSMERSSNVFLLVLQVPRDGKWNM